jgi:hypothetical protein
MAGLLKNEVGLKSHNSVTERIATREEIEENVLDTSAGDQLF